MMNMDASKTTKKKRTAGTNYLIAGADCEGCFYSTIYDNELGRTRAYCAARDKEYYYGTRIPCEEREVWREEEDSDGSED